MSRRTIQQSIFTLRPKSRRKPRTLLHRSEMPIKVDRGELGSLKLLTPTDRLEIRRRVRAQNNRLILTSATIALILASILAIFTTQYLNDVARLM